MASKGMQGRFSSEEIFCFLLKYPLGRNLALIRLKFDEQTPFFPQPEQTPWDEQCEFAVFTEPFQTFCVKHATHGNHEKTKHSKISMISAKLLRKNMENVMLRPGRPKYSAKK